MSAEKATDGGAGTDAAAMPSADVVVDGAVAKKSRAKRTSTQDVRRLPVINRRVAEELAALDAADPWPEAPVRPKTRGDCLPGGCNEQRPCPWVGCKYHLFVDVKPNGAVQVNFPGGFDRMPETCALDMADMADDPRETERDGAPAHEREPHADDAHEESGEEEPEDRAAVKQRLPKSHYINRQTETLERVGAALHLTRERVRQVIAKAIRRARHRTPSRIAIEVRDALEQIEAAPEGASRDTSRHGLPCPVVQRHAPDPTPPAAEVRQVRGADHAPDEVFEDLMRRTDPMRLKKRSRRA